MSKRLLLSIIVPVYNEQDRVENGLGKILKFLEKQEFSWELIVVDDGSSDHTVPITRRVLRDLSNARLIKSRHSGKGGAIKKAVLKASGKWLIYLDIDLATPMEELPKFLEVRDQYDIIMGSRKMKGARVLVHQPKFREFGGKVFTYLTNVLVTKGISDITCGFKLFKTSVAKKLFRQSRLSDWSFDAEILFLAQKNGFSIKELPVLWRDDPQTRVSLFRDTVDSFLGLVKIRFYDLTGRYT